MERLPGIRQITMDFAGVDPILEPIPIQPAQHYSMGGIPTNADGETDLPGLFAAGECACVSVHGANRLGGNSLLETLVFGERAGRNAAQQAGKEKKTLDETIFRKHTGTFQSALENIHGRKAEEPSFLIRDEMKALMTSRVGIFRDESGLLTAREKIQELKKRFLKAGFKQKSLAFNNEFVQHWELEGMLHLAEAIIEGALARKESRGSHFSLDYPKRDDEHWLRHTLVFKTPEGVRLDYKKVSITSHPPKERTY
jgi:succinate dehydrogenase / fumarate reductase flavoprotein subunit